MIPAEIPPGQCPPVLARYRDDLGTLQIDILRGGSGAVGWQTQTISDAMMAKDVLTINNDINQVKSDIQTTQATS